MVQYGILPGCADNPFIDAILITLPHPANSKITKSASECTGKSACNYIRDQEALTHCSRETRKRVIGKQCRPRSDAAKRGV